MKRKKSKDFSVAPFDIESEVATRFIFHSSQYSKENKKAKPAAFMPNRDLEVSTFRIKGLESDDNAIWRLSEEFVEPTRKPQTKARGDFPVIVAKKLGLKLNPDGKPSERHLNLEGWPSTKHEQRLKAIDLAKKAKLYIKS